MKKILIFSIVSFFTWPLFAQKLHIGLLSGINFPNTHVKKESGLSTLKKENKKETMIYGIGLLYSCNNYLNLRSELFYEERGWLVKNAFTVNPGSGNSDKSKINYIYPFLTLPILIEGKIGNNLQFFMNTGINISLRTGGRTEADGRDIPLVFIFPEDKKPTMDFAWVGGTGLRINVNDVISLQSEVRNYRSWTPIGVGYSIDSVIKHKGFLFSISAYCALNNRQKH